MPSPACHDHRMARTTERNLTDEFSDLAHEAMDLLPTLRRLMGEPDTGGPDTGTIGRHAPESSPPWNAEAANAYFTIYHGARLLHETMRYALGLTVLRVPEYGTDALRLAAACSSSVPLETLRDAVRQVAGWVTTAKQIPAIDEAEAWTNVPHVPGSQPPACPYCGTFALRMQRRRGEVRCFFPDCVDSDERPTRARMEVGRLSGDPCLVFADGTTLAFRQTGD